MIAAPLSDLLADCPVSALKAAIVTRLSALLPGVKVVDHPGKVDISDVVAKTVVAAPGVAVGWSRLRPARRADGGWNAQIDLIAYVVTEDMVVGGRRREREQVGLAIGTQILRVLGDEIEPLWDLLEVTPPENVDCKPFFTIRDAAQGVAYYAVTWTQAIASVGAGYWQALPTATTDGDAITWPTEPEMLEALRAAGFGTPESGT